MYIFFHESARVRHKTERGTGHKRMKRGRTRETHRGAHMIYV